MEVRPPPQQRELVSDTTSARIKRVKTFSNLKLKKIGLTKKIKIVFLSVMPALENKKERLRKEGVADYIIKPFTKEKLVRKVKKISG